MLLDDPAAELDVENFARLMALVRDVPAQLWVTSLKPEIVELVEGGRVFHVKQGDIGRL